MSHSHEPQIARITSDQLEVYKDRARLERARAIQRALRRLTGRDRRQSR